MKTLTSVPSTHIKKLGTGVHLQPRAREAERAVPSTANLAYLGSSRPVRDPASKTKVDGN